MAAGVLTCLTLLLTELVADGFFYLLGLIMALLVVALPTLYIRQAGRTGWLGLAGLIMSTTSALVLAVLLTAETVARAAFGFDPEEYGTVFWILAGGLLSFVAGAALFGLDTARAGVLPRWGAALFATGLPAVFVLDIFAGASFGGGATPPGRFIGTPLFAAGLIRLGYALWKDTSDGGPSRAN